MKISTLFKSVVIASAILFLVWGSGIASAGCGFAPDPRYNPDSYRSWCRCMGGTPYTGSYGGPACQPGTGGGSSSGSSGYGGGSDNPFINALPGLMGDFMKGFERGMEQNRQRQLQREQELELQKLEEEKRAEEAKERERLRRLEFEKAKARMLGEMRGLSDSNSEIKLRDLSGLPELKVREIEGTFGTKELKPRDLSGPVQTAYAGSGYGATIKRASCSAYLLKKAEAAASSGKYDEAAYLSNEAADFMGGTKDSPAVACPPPPEVPSVEGVPVKESVDEAERLKKMTILYGELYSRASRQMADYNVVVEGVRKAEDKVKEAETGVTEAETKKAELETQKQPNPQGTPNSAMAEALAALKRAKEALAESEKNLSGLMESKAGMEKEMENTKDLFIQAQKNPEKADEMLKRLDARQGKEEN